jgi:plasmid stabilization system protein ParE
MNVRISRRADRDVDRIWEVISRDSRTAADRVEDKLHEAMKLLGDHPGGWHVRPDVSDLRYRFWSVYSYVIAYRVEGNEVLIVRVIHGARDVRKAMGRQVRA